MKEPIPEHQIKRAKVYYRGLNLESAGSEGQASRIEIRKIIADKCELAKKLPAHKRVLFLMYYDHGHSLREIAQLLNTSDGTVSRRLTKIMNEINEINHKKADEDGSGKGSVSKLMSHKTARQALNL